MSEVYFIKNWFKFQHYKDRNPPWIKLHRSILNDSAVCKLSPAERWKLICLWFLASEHEGCIPCALPVLTRCTGYAQPNHTSCLLAKLESIGLISKQDIRGAQPVVASELLAQRQRERQSKKDNPPTPLRKGGVIQPKKPLPEYTFSNPRPYQEWRAEVIELCKQRIDNGVPFERCVDLTGVAETTILEELRAYADRKLV